MNQPRPEYPRPQFARPDWLCLNGPWQFEIDHGDSGLERGLLQKALSGQITVPFCPESALSGIENTDFMAAVWYRREVEIPAAWKGQRVLLHFGAVDYDATVWADGVEVGRHRGGWCGFTCDLTADLGDIAGRTVTLVVRARDDHRQPKPQGKQTFKYFNDSCLYTRTTGIWQTVWLEPVPKRARLERPRITPSVGRGGFEVVQPVVAASRAGLRVRVALLHEGRELAVEETAADADYQPSVFLAIPPDQVRLWSPQDPHLYDLTLSLIGPQGEVLDTATSHAGLRSVTLDGKRVLLNGEPVFQRLVLDQGFYPDGLLTAPSDDALKRDIQLSLDAGFNGARLHQKVFEERFLYHADRMGYLVWGEFGDWYGDPSHRAKSYDAPTFITQWLEALQRDYNHPCIVGWCPLNETHERIGDDQTAHDDVMLGLFLATKMADATRPVLDTSGYSHRVAQTDVYDSHDYDQDPDSFAKRHAGLARDQPYINASNSIESVAYRGQPYFVSEFGGIWWNPEIGEGEASWGYGNRPTSIDAFYERFEGLVRVLLDDPNMFGYCYTQLTDVFQEQNGIYRFDRTAKLDLQRIRAVQQRPAAIEKTEEQR